MKVERARLWDIPALAWMAAQAFAAESTTNNLRRRAECLYLMHLYSLAMLACVGRLWHGERRVIIVIERKGPPAWWRWFASAVACVAVVVVVVVWIAAAGGDGLQVLSGVMAAGGGLMLLVLVVLVPAVIPALGKMHPRRSARNADAIRQWRRTLPGREAYKVSYLAMYPQTGEGFTFARAAIAYVVPAGAPLYTEARSDRHSTIYARRGFYPLAAADGTPTLALATR